MHVHSLSIPTAVSRSLACGDSSRWSMRMPWVLLPGARLIIPKGVLACSVGDRAQSVGQPEPEQRLEARTRFGPEERIVGPCRRIVDVLRRWNHIEIAGENQRLLRFHPLSRILKKSRHPFEFVRIFFRSDRVAIGQIEAGDAYNAMLQRHHAFEKSRMNVFVVAGQARVGFLQRKLRQQRDAVKGFLAVRHDVVAKRLNGLAGNASSMHLIS